MALSPLQGSRRRRAPMAEINVTPMVDVMLVLLIIFMVTAPLLVAGVPVNLPDSRAKPLEQDQKPVQISLDRAGKLDRKSTRLNSSHLGISYAVFCLKKKKKKKNALIIQ